MVLIQGAWNSVKEIPGNETGQWTGCAIMGLVWLNVLGSHWNCLKFHSSILISLPTIHFFPGSYILTFYNVLHPICFCSVLNVSFFISDIFLLVSSVLVSPGHGHIGCEIPECYAIRIPTLNAFCASTLLASTLLVSTLSMKMLPLCKHPAQSERLEPQNLWVFGCILS